MRHVMEQQQANTWEENNSLKSPTFLIKIVINKAASSEAGVGVRLKNNTQQEKSCTKCLRPAGRKRQKFSLRITLSYKWNFRQTTEHNKIKRFYYI